MPGTPSVSPKFNAPRFANADEADFADQVNGVTDVFDAAALITGGTESLASLAVTGAGSALNVTNDATIGGQLKLTRTGSAGGLLIGGDATLYRNAANGLRTGGALTVDGDTTLSGTLAVAGVSSVAAINSTGAYTQSGTGANTFTGVTTFSSVGTALSVTNAASVGGVLTVSGQLKLPTSGSGAGLLIGGDATLYRNAANSLRTGGALVIDGVVTGPTPTAGDNSTKLATTAFVATSFATLASPALTGSPLAPTASPGTSTTQIATTAFVNTALTAGLGSLANGTVTAPALAFASETGTGVYRPSAGQFAFAVLGSRGATLSASAFDIAAGSKYTIAGTQITAANLGNGTTGTGAVVLATSPTVTGLGTDTLTATGLLSGSAGLTLDAGSGTAGQTVTLTGRSGGTAANSTLVVGTTGALTYNVPTGKTHIFQVAGVTQATIGSTGINLAAGDTYQINGSQISAANLSNGITGTGAVVLAASPTLTAGLTLDGASFGTSQAITLVDRSGLPVTSTIAATGGYLNISSPSGTLFPGPVGFFGNGPRGQMGAVGATGRTGGSIAGITYHPDDTYTGGTGSTGYTVGDVVRALKLLGLIAS